MKNLTLLIFFTFHFSLPILIGITFHSSAQPCLPEGISFTTQAEIDNFQINPTNCTEIEGDIEIIGAFGNITNLNGLSVITSIGGDLLINRQTALFNLTGLENLTMIGGDLSIYRNDTLISLEGLNNLASIGGDLSTGYYGSGYGGNQSLSSISALNNLTSIGGSLIINSNPSLANLSGLNNITFLGGDLRICGNSILASLSGLENITYVPGDMSIGSFHIGGYPMGNPSLTSIMALSNLAHVDGDFEIRFNYALTSLTGLNNLTSVGSLEIYHNYSLSSLAGLENLNLVEGELSLNYIDSITDLTDLNNLESIGGRLSIYVNDDLLNLSGLENINSIGGDVYLAYNYDLTSLTGLDNVTSINGQLRIYDNNSLTSLSGLNNIESSSIHDLHIYENESLSTCEVQSICDYLVSPNGTIEIQNNAPGCNSPEEVEEACEALSVNEVNFLDKISVNPNPSEGIFNVLLEGVKGDIQTKVLDLIGKEHYNFKLNGSASTQLDLSELATGVYFISFSGKDFRQVKKIVIQ